MNNNQDKTQGIKDAAQKKRAETLERVLDALKTMEQEAIPINFESVFNFTRVSKSWLYKKPSVKELIKKAKGKSNNLLIQDQAVQLSAKDQEVNILTKQNKQLRQQIDELRLQLEVSYAAIYKQDS